MGVYIKGINKPESCDDCIFNLDWEECLVKNGKEFDSAEFMYSSCPLQPIDDEMGLCDFFVKDKTNGHIHKVGTDIHDSIWVDFEGTLHYQNLQNGDGCSYKSAKDELQGYEFVPSDCGEIETIKPFGGE